MPSLLKAKSFLLSQVKALDFVFQYWLGLEFRAYTLSHNTSTFLWCVFFRDKVSQTICPGGLEPQSS
jgi:hypothetical protein